MMFFNNRNLGIFCVIYNGKDYVDGYLQDMLEQTIFRQTNFYFLDCASTDGSSEKILEMSKKYNNIFLKILEKDIGLYEGWNYCVKSWMKERYVGNWNIDDRKNPWSLETLLAHIQYDDSLDLVYGQTILTKEKNDNWKTCKSNIVYPCLPHTFDNLLKNNSPHCMPIWKRGIHEKFGYFNNKYKTAADTDMWLRACAGGAKMKMVHDIVGLYYENPTGRSTNPETLAEMVAEVNEVRSKFR